MKIDSSYIGKENGTTLSNRRLDNHRILCDLGKKIFLGHHQDNTPTPLIIEQDEPSSHIRPA